MPSKRAKKDPIEPYRAKLEPLAAPALRLAHTWREAGCSIGGVPRVPAGFVWPSNKDGRPLGFLAQLDLGELRAAAEIDWLPKAGQLLFFYDLIDEPWGFDPAHRGGWKVIYVEGDRALEEAKVPDAPVQTYETTTRPQIDQKMIDAIMKDPSRLAEIVKDAKAAHDAKAAKEPKAPKETRSETVELVFERCGLEPGVFRSFPSFDDPMMRAIWPELIEREDDEAYAVKEAYNAFRAEKFPRPQHQIDGYPVTVQNARIDIDAHLAFQGVHSDDRGKLSQAQYDKLLAGYEDWMLLLQLDSDDGTGWMWGDSGLLYFLVRKDDAPRGNFDDIWVILQCF